VTVILSTDYKVCTFHITPVKIKGNVESILQRLPKLDLRAY